MSNFQESRSDSFEFVTHCWKYSRLFCYQLSSFALFADKSVTVTMYYCEEDEPTKKMVDYFSGLPGPNWSPKAMSRERLCRRAIGRNEAALASKATWIWFADCDYYFGGRLFAALPVALSAVDASHPLVYPGEILQCSQETGDKYIEGIKEPSVVQLSCSSSDFIPHGFRKAIGGVQIVRGDWARANGYCKNHPRHHRPASCWARNIEDCTFRQDTGSSGFRISLPDVLRVRHSKRGGYGPDVNGN